VSHYINFIDLMALSRGYLDIVQLLLEYGADPNISNRHGITAIHAALTSSFGSVQVVELLLEAGADPNMPIQTLTDKSLFAMESYRTLFSNDMPLVGNILMGVTALMLACIKGHLEVVLLLLKANANPNHQITTEGITALIIAVKLGLLT